VAEIRVHLASVTMTVVLIFVLGCLCALGLAGGLLQVFFEFVLRGQYHGRTSPSPNGPNRG